MIQVCDAIMGTGKSSAAITYMNEHSEQKFIYITPYLDEADRIKAGCPELEFKTPSNRISLYKYSKINHTAALIADGANIATTHQAFRCYTPEMLKDISKLEYTLIIDEDVDVLSVIDLPPGDIEILNEIGCVSVKDGMYKYEHDYELRTSMSASLDMIKKHDLYSVDDKKTGSFFFWELPVDLFTSFKDVIILTYMFKGQSLCRFLEMYRLPFKYIGVSKQGGKYSFCNTGGYVPEYVKSLKDKIHIYEGHLNDIGKSRTALSMSWCSVGDNISRLSNNIYNFFINTHRDKPSKLRLWSAYARSVSKIKNKGYTNSNLAFNAKATNSYKHKKVLVYAVNLFMNVGEKLFYQTRGIDPDEDAYALSTMVQWIWRSAIREGEEIDIYIPSKRMRTLLQDWIESLSEDGVANE